MPDPATMDIGVDVSTPYAPWLDALPDVAELSAVAVNSAWRTGHAPDLPVASVKQVEVSVVLVGDDEIHKLNLAYRGFDKPTNVLSFAACDGCEPVVNDGPYLAGDVVVALETCRTEAEQQSKALAHHFIHLIVHGTLHLMGYDHHDDQAAQRMETLERGILAGLGISDPYHSIEEGHN